VNWRWIPDALALIGVTVFCAGAFAQWGIGIGALVSGAAIFVFGFIAFMIQDMKESENERRPR